MKMHHILILCACLSAAAGCGRQVKPFEYNQRLLIAVMPPENATKNEKFTDIIENADGECIALLHKSGRYRIVEREKLNIVMKEHNLAMTGMVDPDTAAQLGKILGLDAVLYTKITRLEISENIRDVPGVSRTDREALCRAEARIIDVRTGEILVSASDEGKKQERDTVISGDIINRKKGSDRRSLLRDSMSEALNRLSAQIIDNAVLRNK